jgi:prevent-host-death family protein
MAVKTITSRQFNQDTSSAKKAARRGPVFITDRGRPAHVLMTIEDYHRLAGDTASLATALAQPGEADFEFNPPRLGSIVKSADLG